MIESAIEDRTSARIPRSEPDATRPARHLIGVRPIPRSEPAALSWLAPSVVPLRDRHPELPGLTGPEPIRPHAEQDDLEPAEQDDRETSEPAEVAPTNGSTRHGSLDILPDAAAWSSWLAQLIVEVVHGRRPASQLARWTEEAVLATVLLRARQLRAPSTGRSRQRTGAASLGSVRIQQPSGKSVEASAVIRGTRCSALAFRLEVRGERWLCTAVDFGPQTPQPT